MSAITLNFSDDIVEPNYSPAILITAIAFLWLIHRALLIGNSKLYEEYVYKIINWFNEKPILTPFFLTVISLLTFPLARPDWELTGAFKQTIAIFTFALGVLISRRKDKSDLIKKDIFIIASIKSELDMNLQALERNQEIIDRQILEYKKHKQDEREGNEHKQEKIGNKKPLFTMDLSGKPFMIERLKPLQKESLESVINNIYAKKATVDNLTKLISKIKEIRSMLDDFNLTLRSGDISNYPQLKDDIYYFSDKLKEKIEQLIIILKNENLLIE
jgi:uncharacterized membrane protein